MNGRGYIAHAFLKEMCLRVSGPGACMCMTRMMTKRMRRATKKKVKMWMAMKTIIMILIMLVAGVGVGGMGTVGGEIISSESFFFKGGRALVPQRRYHVHVESDR